MSARVATGWLIGIAFLTLAVRALDVPKVFVDGEVLLAPWDGSYHARRALYSFEKFPSVLFFDSYLAYPDGAPVPMPPLYDWLLAAVARTFGEDVNTFEHVAAWSSPVLASLTILPVFFAGWIAAGRGVGVGAAALFACLPASELYARVGDPDHHAAVALLVSVFAVLSAALVRSETCRSRLLGVGLGLLVVRAALVLTWSGSLLYLGLGEATLLLAGLLAGRPVILAVQALGAAGAALLLVPWILAGGTPGAGPFSSTNLSWLHCLSLFCVAGLAGGVAILEWLLPARTVPRVVRAALLAAAAAAALLLSSEVREALGPGVGFVTRAGSSTALIAEQVPLFHWTSHWREAWALRLFGALACAIPFVPFAFLWRGRKRRDFPALTVLACWSGALAILAVFQVRFCSDFAPLCSVGFALLLDHVRCGLLRRVPSRFAIAAVSVAAVILVSPAFSAQYSGRVIRLIESPRRKDPALAYSSASLVRFAQLVRSVTPETAGYFDTEPHPEYGILIKPSHGHVMQYAARRATPASGFGPYLDAPKFEKVLAFFEVETEDEAVSIASGLGARYVVTFANDVHHPSTFARMLHRFDGGRSSGYAHGERFRLVVEGPRRGRPLPTAYRHGAPAGVIPYKLFEIVDGAVLEVRAEPNARVSASLELKTNAGRRFVFRAAARADSRGIARLRVPYDTEGRGPTRAAGRYHVTFEGRKALVAVRENDVASGAILRIEP
jgi:dolichyl-diphosphooligosaccharide--protein glycosyltransferase